MFNSKANKNTDSNSYESLASKSASFGTVGKSLNFAAKEAYKQLRTNIDFAMIDEEGCRTIGVTSAVRGDGKSLTSINLAYFLAEDGSKVLLMEGDMRIPTISRKVHLGKTKGLSMLLSENTKEEDMVLSEVVDKQIKVGIDDGRMDILSAGSIPPNPQELLDSSRMREIMAYFKNHYDYIIMDLPPITAVADPLVASKLLDGMVIVVRHDHTERGALNDAIRQLEFAGSRVLGFVYNAANEGDGTYIRKYKYRTRYKQYYKDYYKGYGYYQKSNETNRPAQPSSSKN